MDFARMGKSAFSPLFKQAMSNVTQNGTASSFPANAAATVDSFLNSASHASPIMGLIAFFYRFLGTSLGIDPSLVITTLGFLWGISKLLSQAYTQTKAFIDKYLMSAIFINEQDHIHAHLMKWLSQQKFVSDSQYIMVQTKNNSAWEDEDEAEDALMWTDGGENDGNKRYLNFSNYAAKATPRYVPAMGASYLWHNGTYFQIVRKKETYANTTNWRGGMKDVEELKIACYGRSVAPIKRLLNDAKMYYYQDTFQKTAIYRPRAKEVRRESNMWQQIARRPIRPMRTVVLNSEEKHAVLSDMNDYLHPATPMWYASRGIPLRRGYLFHGPPGTGKTSFSFALAGVFGIDIYVISLQDANVTEEDLAVLFTRLPRRCIVLLEDIDTAGISRDNSVPVESEEAEDADADQETQVNEKEKTPKKAEVNGVKPVDKEPAVSEKDDKMTMKKKKFSRFASGPVRGGRGGMLANMNVTAESISLSGLLNAIDGVASHEGRILIMTTNKPESLDAALLRPGRVDMQVAFKNASNQQATELFQRMYEVSAVSPPSPVDSSISNGNTQAKKNTAETNDFLSQRYNLDISLDKLRKTARKFGELIPEDTLSPAEIQGFLLKRTGDPDKALTEASDWIEATLKQKESRSKVATVQ